MIPTRAKLLTGRAPLAQTVKVMGTVGALYNCRNTGIGYQQMSPNVGMQNKLF